MHESRPEQQQIKLFGTEWYRFRIYQHIYLLLLKVLSCTASRCQCWVGGSLRTCSFLFFGLGAAAFRVDRARRGNVYLEDQAKACSPTDQHVRKFKDSSGINMAMKTFFYIPDRVIFGYPYSSTIIEWRLRRVVPAAAVSYTHLTLPTIYSV